MEEVGNEAPWRNVARFTMAITTYCLRAAVQKSLDPVLPSEVSWKSPLWRNLTDGGGVGGSILVRHFTLSDVSASASSLKLQ